MYGRVLPWQLGVQKDDVGFNGFITHTEGSGQHCRRSLCEKLQGGELLLVLLYFQRTWAREDGEAGFQAWLMGSYLNDKGELCYERVGAISEKKLAGNDEDVSLHEALDDLVENMELE